ncbi:MAG: hypothetical protein H6981_03090 [Gammaproteobacteria bacterium]|nr:hypothetical protein [Gammaproteobacteria bacterium]MCP5135774.1 hypothetical protein [Gammaproteobacteria bacterium]
MAVKVAQRKQSPEHLVEDVIEQMCQAGCKTVLQKIDALERGEIIPECERLDCNSRHVVLHELKSIMAVYGNVCRL